MKESGGFWNNLCSVFQEFTNKKHNITYWCFFLMTDFILEVVVDKENSWTLIAVGSICLLMILSNYLRIVKALHFFRGLTLFFLIICLAFIVTTIAFYFFTRKSFQWLVKYVFDGAMAACGCLIQYAFISDAIISATSSNSRLDTVKLLTVDQKETVILPNF